jgi:hypothetical protein
MDSIIDESNDVGIGSHCYQLGPIAECRLLCKFQVIKEMMSLFHATCNMNLGGARGI